MKACFAVTIALCLIIFACHKPDDAPQATTGDSTNISQPTCPTYFIKTAGYIALLGFTKAELDTVVLSVKDAGSSWRTDTLFSRQFSFHDSMALLDFPVTIPLKTGYHGVEQQQEYVVSVPTTSSVYRILDAGYNAYHAACLVTSAPAPLGGSRRPSVPCGPDTAMINGVKVIASSWSLYTSGLFTLHK